MLFADRKSDFLVMQPGHVFPPAGLLYLQRNSLGTSAKRIDFGLPRILGTVVFGLQYPVGGDHDIVTTKTADSFGGVDFSIVSLGRPDRVVEPFGCVHLFLRFTSL